MSDETADIVIVGAGAAGLAAANRLSESGLRVVILEARDRIGGRILTIRDASVSMPLELGAEFLHGKAETVFPLIRAARLGFHEIPVEGWLCNQQGLQKSNVIMEAWEQASKAMKGANSENDFDTFIRSTKLSNAARELATSYVEGFHAAHPDRVSIQSLVLENEASARVHGDKLFVLDQGYDALMRSYVEKCNATVRLNNRVRTIAWTRGRVHVEFTDGGSSRKGALTARMAIITIPLPLLQSDEAEGTLRFEPDVPSIRAAARQLAMGQVVKISMNFSDPIWQDAVGARPGFLFCPDAPYPTWWFSRPGVITAWAGGPPAEELLAQSVEYRVSTAVQTLSEILHTAESRVKRTLISHYCHDWSRDPFSLGAYTYTPVGCFNARSILATPIQETLFFAGEAANTTGAHGTVHGAVETGLLAARQIAQTVSA